MVANDNGKMPKSYLIKLRSLAKYDWKYEANAECFFAEINDIEDAKLVAIKVIAAMTQECPSCYCSYMNDRTTMFYQDRLNGYREV